MARGAWPEAAARIVVLASVAGAIAVQAWLESQRWPGLFWQTALTFAAAWVAGTWLPARSRSTFIFLVPLLRLLVHVTTGYRSPTMTPLWAAGTLGLILASAPATRWSLPRSWSLALGLWALIVALCWPIVVAREIDFYLPLIYASRTAISSGGIPPGVQAAWVASVAVALMLPLLWFDALVAAYAARERFEREIILPLAAACGLAGLLGTYQLFVDVTFLNRTLFGHIGRAGGTLLDANSYGVAMALGVAMSARFATLTSGTGPRLLWLLASAAMLLGVWASASRTAALVAVTVLFGWGWILLRRRLSTVRAGIAIAVLVLVAISAAAVGARTGIGGPIGRLGQSLDDRSSKRALSRVLVDLWERDGYGTAALRFVEVSPLFGVGVGSFHALVLDQSRQAESGQLRPDNAQNWPRHHLAEQGFLGSAGWIWWTFLFAIFLWKTRWRWTSQLPLLPVAALAGLAAASQVGMPTQNAIVAMLAWTCVAWVLLLIGEPAPLPESQRPARSWAGVWALALVCALGTAWLAVTDLRVPNRAVAAGWPYSYGLHRLGGPEGSQYRWTRERAVAVFPARLGYLRLAYWVQHPDVAENPVRVRIWRGDELVADTTFADQNPRTLYLFNRGNQPWMMIAAEVSRTWTPPSEVRSLGVALSDWQFVTRPPEGATVID